MSWPQPIVSAAAAQTLRPACYKLRSAGFEAWVRPSPDRHLPVTSFVFASENEGGHGLSSEFMTGNTVPDRRVLFDFAVKFSNGDAIADEALAAHLVGTA